MSGRNVYLGERKESEKLLHSIRGGRHNDSGAEWHKWVIGIAEQRALPITL